VDTSVSEEHATSILRIELPEERGRIFLGNVGVHLQDFATQKTYRHENFKSYISEINFTSSKLIFLRSDL
jgi:hypothetical protein